MEFDIKKTTKVGNNLTRYDLSFDNEDIGMLILDKRVSLKRIINNKVFIK